MHLGVTAFGLADILDMMTDEWGIVPLPWVEPIGIIGQFKH